MEPLFEDKGAFSYEELTQKYNEVFTERKSSRTLRRYGELLEEIGWVTTEPDPSDKRKNLISVIKKHENTVFSALSAFPPSFTLEKLEKWFKQIVTHKPILLRENILHVESNIPLNTLYKNYYCVTISSEPKQLSNQEIKRENKINWGNTVIPSVQEAVEYAFEMMAKRLPNKTTEDDFLHDLKWKGKLSDEEARKLLEGLFEERKVGQDRDGWLVKI